MFGHWYVVASQKTVKIFTETSDRKKIKQVREFDNPLGRERNKALVKKRAGKGIKSIGRTGTVYFSQKTRKEPHQVAALQFAKKIAVALNEDYRLKNFETLSVVAEPHFLGLLRASLDPKISHTVKEWKKKDLLKTPKIKLVQYLLA